MDRYEIWYRHLSSSNHNHFGLPMTFTLSATSRLVISFTSNTSWISVKFSTDIHRILTHSSSLSSAGCPSSCYKLMLWSSSHCQSGLLAVKDKKHGCYICVQRHDMKKKPIIERAQLHFKITKIKQIIDNFTRMNVSIIKMNIPTFEMISEMFFRDCLMGYLAMSH